MIARWVWAAVIGLIAGGSSWAFLFGLDRLTDWRIDHEQIVWLLPVVGALVATLAVRFVPRALGGTPKVVLSARSTEGLAEGIPSTMAPYIFFGAWISHAVGASVGREGVGLQLAGSLSDTAMRRAKVSTDDRSLLTAAALAAGFAAMFGVPVTGVVFAMELVRRRVFVPLVIAATVGDVTVRVLGHHHQTWPHLHVASGPTALGQAAILGVGLGLVAQIFLRSIEQLRAVTRRLPRPAGTALAGVAMLAVITIGGHQYEGLSMPLAMAAVGGAHVMAAPIGKFLATVICVGGGFPGGEVTPLFVIGATTGAVFAHLLGGSIPAGAAIGLVTVFAAAAHVPLTGIVLGVELFGFGPLWLFVVAGVAARAVVGSRSLYLEDLHRHH